jgi:dolichol-phosphate mannosyltransferase
MAEVKMDWKTLAFFPAYNEEGKIGRAVSTVPRGAVDQVLVIDDGSTDRTPHEAKDAGALVISARRREGVGSVIRRAIDYARENNFSIIVILAGNGKDDGGQIPRLLEPIVREGYDFVQGSRFLKGGCYGKTPLYRVIATKYVHPLLFSLFVGRWITDSTNGFRAIRLDIFRDTRMNLHQEWLDTYALEPYIFFKAIKLGYKVREVPVSKIYPSKKIGYTKMRPVTDWWAILKPIFVLGLGIKR